jgi:hypothetical protein
MSLFSSHDTTILRQLARQVAEAAAHPHMTQRRQRWAEHNALRSRYPLMLVFPEGAWEELSQQYALQCESERARRIEWHLWSRLYTAQHFADDTVLEAEWVETAVVGDTGWGLEPVRRHSDSARGAYEIEPVIAEYADIAKLRHPDLRYDEAATRQNAEQMHDLFGDLLTIRRKGVAHISYHLAAQYIYLRGLNNLLMDMSDAPDFVHEMMAFFEAGHHRLRQQMIDLNLLSLNNDSTYHSSGGNGYTDELPAPGFDANRVRPLDMWASAESQEMAVVSPRMHASFLMPYEARLLEPFGLTGYGCCEDLTRKLDNVIADGRPALPHMRRISISPFADVDRCAEKLRGDFIYSWKPNPAHLVGQFDPAAIYAYVRHTLEVCQANGCVLEIILKDTHTCENHPERFDQWTQIARQAIVDVAGEA